MPPASKMDMQKYPLKSVAENENAESSYSAGKINVTKSVKFGSVNEIQEIDSIVESHGQYVWYTISEIQSMATKNQVVANKINKYGPVKETRFHTNRGLETLVSKRVLDYNTRRRKAWNVVLDEQRRQRDRNANNPNIIAILYHGKGGASKCQEYAVAVAAQDQRDAEWTEEITPDESKPKISEESSALDESARTKDREVDNIIPNLRAFLHFGKGGVSKSQTAAAAGYHKDSCSTIRTATSASSSSISSSSTVRSREKIVNKKHTGVPNTKIRNRVMNFGLSWGINQNRAEF